MGIGRSSSSVSRDAEHHHRVVTSLLLRWLKMPAKYPWCICAARRVLSQAHAATCQVVNGWWLASVRQGVVGNTSFGISSIRAASRIGPSLWREGRHHDCYTTSLYPPYTAHHQPQEAVQRNQVGAQRIVGFFGIDLR